ncbi:sulfite exporter TauE/SafE family protein [Halodesulfovibrio spirochaetisodalis]|uniref:sulfite exporter TauE/SafE family protein n=1 Tax=Halodesulfovibrio spirochaetisodalis TaxID=1560234 RepID=UPI00082DA87B|nr:sulfite exporter TauE/SafE family protein [Halodesulfovibrio spirochaetisodalis]
MEHLFFVALCWGIGGFVNGVAGFGAALIAMPLITTMVPLSLAVPSCTIIGVSLCLQMAWIYRKNIDFQKLKPIYLGTVPGAIVGISMMQELPTHYLKLGMGIFLFIYALWGLFFEGRQQKIVHRGWGVVAGFCSTAISSSIGMGGPPTIVYTSLTGWGKDTVKAAIASYFIVSGVLIISMQTYAGIQTKETVMLFAAAAPAVMIGARLGVLASRKIGEFTYRKVLFGMLVVMACIILNSAYTQFAALA